MSPGLRDALGLTALLSVVGAFAPWLLFNAHQALDRPSPDQASAAGWLVPLALLLVAVPVAGFLALRQRAAATLGIAAVAAFPVAVYTVAMFQSWGWFGGVGMAVVYFYAGVPALVAVAIMAVLAAANRSEAGAAGAAGVAIGWCIAWAAAGLYVLLTLPMQASQAAAAHRSPGAGILVAAAVVACAALARRRGR